MQSGTPVGGLMAQDRADGQVEFEDVFVLRETPRAILCRIDGQNIWIPQSQVHADSEIWKVGDHGLLVVSEFIAKEKGLV